MPVVKRFTQAQWDAAARRLDALPEKPAHEHRVNVRDAVKSMQAQISGAQRKGYTLEEIVQQLAQEGVDISASTLRYAMKRTTKESKSEPVGQTISTAPTIASRRAKKSNPTRPSRVDGTGKESERGRGKAVTRPGAMVIQDAFSFEITPDTENL
ncbi:hypothetical protein DID96_35530 [Burkholderia sp. Bp8963]|uniref:hypothetical protein n=1 Tax=Burkholderia sp. Bp8963 TaxID=2184547 RepID=UPI000F59C902|nr:hypothetical protein [Burkholderia sp. Bp8963]RQS59099.1 hypothetical protein DID96_35530 [Burkholderia sp. Bp8963]